MLKGVVQFWQTGPLCLTSSSGDLILCRHYGNLQEAVEDFIPVQGLRILRQLMISKFSFVVNSLFNNGLRLFEWMKCLHFCSGRLCMTLKGDHWLWKKAQAQIMTSRETYVCSFSCLCCIFHSDGQSAVKLSVVLGLWILILHLKLKDDDFP